MERESFEDEETAAVLNAHFVAIKVDREERPDIDALYMGAVQAITGQGGWPMSVFLTPEGRPFFGGTYFPDTQRHGLPSFRQVLEGVRLAWFERRAELEEAGARLVEALAEQQRAGSASSGLPPASVLDGGGRRHRRGLRSRQRRLGPRAQVPAADADRGAAAATRGRRRAAPAGDRAPEPGRDGGGRRPRPARRRLPPLLHGRPLAGPALRADALRQRAARPRLRACLGAHGRGPLPRDRDRARSTTCCASCGCPRAASPPARTRTPRARRGRPSSGRPPRSARSWAPTPRCSPRRTAPRTRGTGRVTRSCRGRATTRSWGSGSGSGQRRWASGWPRRGGCCWTGGPRGPSPPGTTRCWRPGTASRSARSRMRPGRSARRGALALDADAVRYRDAAVAAASAVTSRLLGEDGRLRRSWKDGRGTADGVLEDYANLAEGLLALYEATGDERWFTIAVGLADAILARFGDPAGGFFDTADDGEPLVVRPKGLGDNAVPSGGAMASTVLLRLAALTGEARYRTAAERALATVGPYLARYPTGFAQWLCALELAHAGHHRGGHHRRPGRRRSPRGSCASRTAGTTRSASWRCPRRRRRRRCRSWWTGSRSTDGRRRSCAATSRAVSRCTSRRRWTRCWSGRDRGCHRPPRPGRRVRGGRGPRGGGVPDASGHGGRRRVPRPRPRRAGAGDRGRRARRRGRSTAGCSGA